MHAMQQIAQQGAVQVSKSAELQSGRYHLAASTIWSTFGKGQDNAKTRTLYDLVQEGFTFAEYAQIERMALDMAKAADSATGWQPPTGAKGRETYGPKQSSMAQRASERKQVFGVLKQNFSAIVSVPPSGIVNPDTLPTFDAALVSARKWLRGQGLTWDGQSRAVIASNAQQALLTDATAEAHAEVMRENPIQDGETREAYRQRIGALIDERTDELTEEKRKEKADTIAAKLVRDHGLPLCLLIAEYITSAASNPAPLDDKSAEGGETSPPVTPETDTKPAGTKLVSEAVTE